MTVLPVLSLGLAIYFEDEHPEPIKTVLKVFALGTLSIPITLLLKFIVSLFFDIESTPFRQAFFSAGVIEEFSKWLIFMLFVWRRKEFDEPFDAIVYTGIIALAFACIENFMYVFSNSVEVAYLRAIFAVPGHFFDGVTMGYFLAKARFHQHAKWRNFILSLLFPILLHGCYDYILMLGNQLSQEFNEHIYIIFLILFLWFDYKLWGIAVKFLGRLKIDNNIYHQEQVLNEFDATHTIDNELGDDDNDYYNDIKNESPHNTPNQ
ncbi:MAG: PrsW family glutamic-type intramembrane protease [Bacteroidales bacterium]|nr:PrsW family glutamic-type intramembrane protease [Bacteroidales bacterium]